MRRVFIKQKDNIQPCPHVPVGCSPFHVKADGTFLFEVEKDYVYTITTDLTAGSKGSIASAPIPPPSAFPLPYSDDFASTKLGQEPAFLADQAGSFEMVPSSAAPHGKVHKRSRLRTP